MCGFVGLFHPREPRRFDRGLLRRMNDTLAPRGPDGAGEHLEPHVALAHRRLAIIDVEGGVQPLGNEDGSVIVVFNGEIYNHAELQAELAALGHRFATRSDTEAIVHAWEAWGPRCVDRLRGMFAFAIWDRPRRTLFLARDRFGVKPLYWSLLPDGTLAFGSELKSLAAHPGFVRTLDERALADYLAFGFIPDPATAWSGAYKLPPAHRLTFAVGDSAPRIERWWSVDWRPDPALARLGDAEAAEALRDHVRTSVRLRMIADVPVGAFLSGGIDSGAVVASMAELAGRSVRTCSIGFEEASHDESGAARAVARHLGTQHRERRMRPDAYALVDQVAAAFDEPFADASALPTWCVSELARGVVKVALSGDGGDELLAGYRRQRLHMAEQRWRDLLPGAIRRPLFGMLASLYPRLDWAPRPLRARATLRGLSLDATDAYFDSVAIMPGDTRARLLDARWHARLDGHDPRSHMHRHAAEFCGGDALALVQHLDQRLWLAGGVLVKVDRMSMAHGLEVREPLLDHVLAEWTARLPLRQRIRSGQGKWLLRHAFADGLPDGHAWRSKMGFSMPLADWLRGALRQRVTAISSASPAYDAGALDRATVRRLTDEHLSGRANHDRALWAVLMFDAFLRVAADGAGAAPAPRGEAALAD